MAFELYVRKKEIEGVFFDFWIGDEAAREWYDLDSYDGSWPEMRFIRDRLLRPGDTIFECGAHHGCTAMALSAWTGPQGRVIAFEPSPYNAGMIRKNVELNGRENVIVEEKAVGMTEGKAFISEKSNSSVIPNAVSGREVEVACLDAYAHLDPDLLKIDVEGYEVEVLKGAQQVLRKTPALAVEIHPGAIVRFGSSVEQLLSMIDASKYDLWMLWDDNGEPVPYTMGEPVTERAHLFGIPRTRPGHEAGAQPR